MSFFFVWMRLSSMKQLDWYRNSSYQSKDIAHVQKTTTQRIADKVQPQWFAALHDFTAKVKQPLGTYLLLLKRYCNRIPGICMVSLGFLGIKRSFKAVLVSSTNGLSQHVAMLWSEGDTV